MRIAMLEVNIDFVNIDFLPLMIILKQSNGKVGGF